MVKRAYVTFVSETFLRWSLILITVFSWFIFPLMAKQLNPTAFNVGFSLCLLSVILLVAVTLTKNQLALHLSDKILFICWIGYLFALLLASLQSGSAYSLAQWYILVLKFIFLGFILFYIDIKYIVTTLRIYANLMVVIVLFALITVFAVILGAHPLTIVDLGGRSVDVYFGSYYVTNTSVFMPSQIFRIQGLSEEPGTFAFTLLPAFFWLLIAEKAYVRSAVIILGLMFSMSLGAGLLLLLLSSIIYRKSSLDNKARTFILCAVGAIGLMYVVSSSCMNRYFDRIDNASLLSMAEKACPVEMAFDRNSCIDKVVASLSTSPSGKIHSLQDRVDGVLVAWNYLKINAMGTGAALGMTTVKNSISVGYAIAALEAGVIGGILYLCLFSIMGWQSLKIITAINVCNLDGQLKMVVALCVFTVLMMGAQRIQPDLSLWHMWIYAMFFFYYRKCPMLRIHSDLRKFDNHFTD